MATNELTTRFVFDDRDGIKIDSIQKKLTDANDRFNNFGKNSVIGKNIADSIKPAENALDSLKNKVDTSFQKPTISRYWETEEQKTIGSLKAIEKAVIKTNNSLSNVGSSPLPTKPNSVLTEQPKIKFAVDEKNFIDLDKLQKKADDTKKAFADISAQRLNSGQIGVLTKEIVTAHERSRQLASDIRNIKTELANPNRKSSIRFLTEELQAAEREADQLNRKLNTLPSANNRFGGRASGNNPLKLSSFQKQNLSYQINDVLTGLASGQNITQIAAQQSGQIAQIFNPAQASALVAAYGSLVTILGAGAGALLLTYKITGDIRAEAEKRLKIETMISAEGNRQALAQKQNLKDFIELRKEAENARNFSSFLNSGTIDDLNKKRVNLEKIVSIDSTSEKSKIFQNEIVQIDAQINAIQQRNAKTTDDVFNQRWINWKKSQESAIESEKKFQIEVEKSKEKIKSAFIDFNDSFISVKSQNNPFVKVLSDIDTVGERAQKRFGALGKEFVKMAADFEKVNLTKQLDELKFSNDLSALKITQDVRRIDLLPNNQRFEFTRGLENLNQLSEFAFNFNNLSRKIAEAQYYSDRFNPNNPKSFAEYNRRGIKDDISEAGLQIRYAIDDIRKLNSIDLQGTGIYGQGAIADKILSIIPSRDDLLRRLNNPQMRNDAQFLLSQQSNALISKRALEAQKLDDFFANQRYNDLRRTDAREQLDLLKNSIGLDRGFYNQQFLKITDEIGVQNLDRGLLSARRDAQLEAVNLLREQFKKAEKEAAENRERNKKLEMFLEKVTGLLTVNGLKVDVGDTPVTEVVIRDETRFSSISTGAAGTMYDVAEAYGHELS